MGEPFDTALEIAKHMIPKRGWETDVELMDKVYALERKCYSPSAVTFHTCNYDTFIAKVGEHFLIETSHHGDWDLHSFRTPCPEEYTEAYGDDGFYRLPQSMDFYSLEHDVTGRPLDFESSKKYEDNRCPKCYCDYWVIDSIYRCPECGGQPKRKK